jgi:L-seryl-tRNA(Ser) seleniumtransferase
MLSALCRATEVIISRGQLVEIGGGFRIPDVLAQSGARLVEVGTTNRTHLRDYAEAITEHTAAILVAHHSNYKIIGFTSQPEMAELAPWPMSAACGCCSTRVAAARDVAPYGLEPEATIARRAEGRADVVAFSGDKLPRQATGGHPRRPGRTHWPDWRATRWPACAPTRWPWRRLAAARPLFGRAGGAQCRCGA